MNWRQESSSDGSHLIFLLFYCFLVVLERNGDFFPLVDIFSLLRGQKKQKEKNNSSWEKLLRYKTESINLCKLRLDIHFTKFHKLEN